MVCTNHSFLREWAPQDVDEKKPRDKIKDEKALNFLFSYERRQSEYYCVRLFKDEGQEFLVFGEERPLCCTQG